LSLQRPTLELSMIVKDGGAALGRCLSSAAAVVDRMVVGDTGSSDSSVKVARGFGAEVVAIPWEHDFARARNRVLARAECDWILVMDADEMLGSDAPERIPELIAREDIFAYDVWRWNYLRASQSRSAEQAPMPNPVAVEAARPYPAYALSLNTRLFRRHPEIYFEHCVHETVSGRVSALGLARAEASFVIHHFGQAEDAPAVRAAKNETYQQLGLRKLAAEPENHRAWFEFGLGELEHCHRPSTALTCFERACALEPGDASAWLFAGICLVRAGRLKEAIDRLARAHRLGLRTPVLFEALGDAYFHGQRYSLAGECYLEAIAAGGISALNRAKLGACEVCQGKTEGGLRRIEEAIAANGEFAELREILAAAIAVSRQLQSVGQGSAAGAESATPK